MTSPLLWLTGYSGFSGESLRSRSKVLTSVFKNGSNREAVAAQAVLHSIASVRRRSATGRPIGWRVTVGRLRMKMESVAGLDDAIP